PRGPGDACRHAERRRRRHRGNLRALPDAARHARPHPARARGHRAGLQTFRAGRWPPPAATVLISGATHRVMTKTVYLGLGSNLGDRAANLELAIAGLAAAGVHVVRRSSLYATEPVGSGPQHWFLNSVVEASTDLLPRQLLRATQQVER